jgi:hypothetical protein
MVWGLFPGVYKNVSWESHMLGFFSGVVLAVLYKKQGPQRPVYDWMQDGEPYADESREEYRECENGGTEEGDEEIL